MITLLGSKIEEKLFLSTIEEILGWPTTFDFKLRFKLDKNMVKHCETDYFRFTRAVNPNWQICFPLWQFLFNARHFITQARDVDELAWDRFYWLHIF